MVTCNAHDFVIGSSNLSTAHIRSYISRYYCETYLYIYIGKNIIL